MVNIVELYNYIQNKNEKDISNINNIYKFLQLKKYIDNINVKDNKKKFISKLDKNEKTIYKKFNGKISLNKYEKILKKLKNIEKKIEKNIRTNLKKYTENNINDLIILHKNLKDIRKDILNEGILGENRIKFIETKEDIIKWWDWIDEKIINNVKGNNIKTKEEKMVYNIIKYLILKNNIDLIEYNINKLIIIDIKNMNTIEEFSEDVIINCYKYINENLVKLMNKNVEEKYEKLNKEIIYKYLVENKLLYDIEDENIIFKIIDTNKKEYEELNKLYNIFTNIDIILKTQYNETDNITMTDELYQYILEFNNKIKLLSLSETVENIELDIEENNMSILKKYHMYINYLFKLTNNIFNNYLEKKIEKKGLCYNCILKKQTIMKSLYMK